MPTRTSLLAAAAAALVLGAGGCGDSGTATSSTAAATDDPAVAKTSDRGDGSLTLGRAAIVPFVDYGTPNQSKPTKVGVRVHELRRGKIADFKGFDLEPAQRRATPYYIDATFENRGDFTVTRHLLRASVEDTDGREYRPATLIVLGGTFKPCPQGRETKLAPGESFTGCAAVLLPRGTELERVRFQGDVTKDPLFWHPN